MIRYEVKVAETGAPYRYWTVWVDAEDVASAISVAFSLAAAAKCTSPPYLVDARRVD